MRVQIAERPSAPSDFSTAFKIIPYQKMGGHDESSRFLLSVFGWK
jgi:hypothetical protein